MVRGLGARRRHTSGPRAWRMSLRVRRRLASASASRTPSMFSTPLIRRGCMAAALCLTFGIVVRLQRPANASPTRTLRFAFGAVGLTRGEVLRVSFSDAAVEDPNLHRFMVQFQFF